MPIVWEPSTRGKDPGVLPRSENNDFRGPHRSSLPPRWRLRFLASAVFAAAPRRATPPTAPGPTAGLLAGATPARGNRGLARRRCRAPVPLRSAASPVAPEEAGTGQAGSDWTPVGKPVTAGRDGRRPVRPESRQAWVDTHSLALRACILGVKMRHSVALWGENQWITIRGAPGATRSSWIS